MSYKCSRCERDVELDKFGGVRCPYCGHHVLLKERSPNIKEVAVEQRTPRAQRFARIRLPR